MRTFCLITALLSTYYGFALAATCAGNQPDAAENPFVEWRNRACLSYNAQPLSWSTTLVSKAQIWADDCNFEYTNGQLGPYGENIAAGTGNFTAESAMDMFMDGLRTFDPNNPAFSDFTQVIWRSTTKLGCASTRCSGIFDVVFGEATMYVCLYEPVGNVVGALVDNIGTL